MVFTHLEVANRDGEQPSLVAVEGHSPANRTPARALESFDILGRSKYQKGSGWGWGWSVLVSFSSPQSPKQTAGAGEFPGNPHKWSLLFVVKSEAKRNFRESSARTTAALAPKSVQEEIRHPTTSHQETPLRFLAARL